MRSVSTCLVSNKAKVNMCVCGRMPVSMVQSWRLKKEGVVPGEGEGESLTVGKRTKKCECARCYPMRRRSSDKRYVAYSVTLKRDDNTEEPTCNE